MTQDAAGVEQQSPGCGLCGAAGEVLYSGLGDRHFSVPGTWDILLCRACDYTWLSPLPLEDDIAGFYADYYTHREAAAPHEPTGLGRLLKLCLPAVMLGHELPMSGAERALARLFSVLGPLRDMAAPLIMWLEGTDRGRLLDVGCGSGEFLVRMRALGWDVQGLEPDSAACMLAREVCGLQVAEGTLAQARMEAEQFDVVTANHVLEHALDPIAMLRECARVLRPGGKLVVTTPNIRSLGCDHFREAWLHWDPPRHIRGFGPRALRICLERAGLEVERMVSAANLARATWWASAALRRDGRLPGMAIRPNGRLDWVQGVAFWLVEYAVSRFHLCGENLAAVAKKPV